MGRFGVAHAAQNGRAEVVDHDARHADEIDAQVQNGQIHDVFRHVHEAQQHGREKLPRHEQKEAAHYGDGHDRMDRRLTGLLILSADVSGNDHVGAHREAEKEIDDEVDDRSVSADGGHGLSSDEVTDDGDVCGNEQLLQNAAHGNGQGKENDFAQERAVQHVNVLGMSHRFLLHGIMDRDARSIRQKASEELC